MMTLGRIMRRIKSVVPCVRRKTGVFTPAGIYVLPGISEGGAATPPSYLVDPYSSTVGCSKHPTRNGAKGGP